MEHHRLDWQVYYAVERLPKKVKNIVKKIRKKLRFRDCRGNYREIYEPTEYPEVPSCMFKKRKTKCTDQIVLR